MIERRHQGIVASSDQRGRGTGDEGRQTFRLPLGEDAEVPTHAHENEQFAYVIRGRVRFGIGAEGSPQRDEIEMTGGEVLHLPANVPHSVVALQETLVLDLFSPQSEKTGIDRD